MGVAAQKVNQNLPNSGVGLGISTVGYGFIDWDEKNEKPIASGLILNPSLAESGK